MEHSVELEHVRLLVPLVLHARFARNLDEAVALRQYFLGGSCGVVLSKGGDRMGGGREGGGGGE